MGPFSGSSQSFAARHKQFQIAAMTKHGLNEVRNRLYNVLTRIEYQERLAKSKMLAQFLERIAAWRELQCLAYDLSCSGTIGDMRKINEADHAVKVCRITLCDCDCDRRFADTAWPSNGH